MGKTGFGIYTSATICFSIFWLLWNNMAQADSSVGCWHWTHHWLDACIEMPDSQSHFPFLKAPSIQRYSCDTRFFHIQLAPIMRSRRNTHNNIIETYTLHWSFVWVLVQYCSESWDIFFTFLEILSRSNRKWLWKRKWSRVSRFILKFCRIWGFMRNMLDLMNILSQIV